MPAAKTAPTGKAPSARNATPSACSAGSLLVRNCRGSAAAGNLNRPRFPSRPRPRNFEDGNEDDDEIKSGAELVEHLRIRPHQADEIFRLEPAERAAVGAGFRETFQFVRTAQRRIQQHRLRVPRMTLDRARG